MTDDRPQVFHTTVTSPEGKEINVGGLSQQDLDAKVAALRASWGKSTARDAFLAGFVAAARSALETNLGIRETNAGLIVQLDQFIGGAAPAGSPGEQLAWLYARAKDLASVVRMCLLENNVMTNEADGLIHLFAAVLPELDDLLDVN